MGMPDERDEEMERDGFEIEVGGRTVHISSEAIEERMKLMYIDSESEAVEDARIMADAFASSLTPAQIDAPDFEQRVLKYLDCDVDVYRR